MQVLGWDGRQRIISLFVSNLKPLKSCISNVEVSLKILRPLKMFGLSKLSEGRQLTGREEVRGSSLSLSSIDEVDNQHLYFYQKLAWSAAGKDYYRENVNWSLQLLRAGRTNQLPLWKTNIFKVKYFLNSDWDCCTTDCCQQGPTKSWPHLSLTVQFSSVQFSEALIYSNLSLSLIKLLRFKQRHHADPTELNVTNGWKLIL